MPEEDNKNFLVRKWVPQVELLAHPALKAGLTHCGFGGTLEFISAGKPIVAFPHFDDQPADAKELERRQVAVMLAYREASTFDWYPDQQISYEEPVFDHNKVYEVFHEVLTNPKYERNMKKLQKIQ